MEMIKIVKKKKNHGKVVENSIVKSNRKFKRINTIVKSHENQYYHKKPQKNYGNYKSCKKLQESKCHW